MGIINKVLDRFIPGMSTMEILEVLKRQKLYITKDIPGCGGAIKTMPSDFIVEEIPQYPPCGKGSHLYLTIEKKQMTTFAVAAHLQEIYDVSEFAVGFAGIKDKESIAVQNFSIDLELKDEVLDPFSIKHPNYRVLSYSWHTNKLKRGHLLGNRFKLIIRNGKPNQLETIQAKLDELEQIGLPNYYDDQRFMEDLNTAFITKVLMKRKINHPFNKKYQIQLSSIQSAIFNGYLTKRIEEGMYGVLLDGDVVKDQGSGTFFIIDKQAKNEERLKKREISITGPIFGNRMLMPASHSYFFENQYLHFLLNVYPELGFIQTNGTRRDLQSFPIINEIQSLENPGDYYLDFILQKGSYATRLASELILP